MQDAHPRQSIFLLVIQLARTSVCLCPPKVIGRRRIPNYGASLCFFFCDITPTPAGDSHTHVGKILNLINSLCFVCFGLEVTGFHLCNVHFSFPLQRQSTHTDTVCSMHGWQYLEITLTFSDIAGQSFFVFKCHIQFLFCWIFDLLSS